MIYSSLCIVVIYLYSIHAYEIGNTYDDGGWRPISNLEALGRFGIIIQNPNNIQNTRTMWNPTEDVIEENVNVLKNSVFKIVEPQHVFGDFQIKRNGFSLPMDESSTKHPNDYQRKPRKYDKLGESDSIKTRKEITKLPNDAHKSTHKYFDIIDITKPTPDKNVRKAKKITADRINGNIIHTVLKQEDPIDLKPESTKKEIIEDGKNSYEVTENSEAIDFHAEQSQKHAGYFYKPSKHTFNETKSNLTDNFFNILSKYNANSDVSQNYILSRIPNAVNPSKVDHSFRIPSHSFNYLPINPLLAVLLSNYGYYIPGAYGIRNNYRNLYGYLASNNIHNNKPFGSYKVYSDNDSSNK